MYTPTQPTTNAPVDLPSGAVSSSVGEEGAVDKCGRRALGYLIGVNGAAEDIIIELYEGGHVLGRGGAARVRLADERMSREHCLLLVTAKGSVTLIDLHSSNGSVVNGRRIKKARLEAGDEMRIGGCIFKFVTEGDELLDVDGSSVVSTDLLQ